jgi:SAM (Sterile alpha motif) domain-containing protein
MSHENAMDPLAVALEALGLGRYAEAFRAADVDFDTLKLLTEDDLRSCTRLKPLLRLGLGDEPS